MGVCYNVCCIVEYWRCICWLEIQVHKPLDIRGKKTRALRRKLTPEQATKLTVKGKKKATHFPARKFAVKA
jgi:hypothetical protein